MKRTTRMAALVLGLAVLFTSFMFSAPVNVGAAVSSRRIVMVTGNRVNIRSGAGTEYGRLNTLSAGVYYDYISSQKAKNGVVWHRFRYGSRDAFISSDYSSVSAVIEGKNVQVLGSPRTNVRRSATTNSEVITSVAPGTKFRAIGSIKGVDGRIWYHVDCNGANGFIASWNSELLLNRPHDDQGCHRGL